MYSLVLMMALSGSAEAPSFGGRGCNGCNGCNGCWASSCNGCCGGYSCHGCSGSCNGCRGGFLGGLFGKNKGCHGCNGCNGCCGGYSCHGCNGCHGAVIHTGCCGGTVVAPAAPAEPKKEMKEPAKEEKPAAPGAAAAAPATLVVSLPADAKLTIDESATKAIDAVRTFVTPTLEAGKDFTYSLKAEVVRNGQTLTATQNVTVRAGQVSRITLEIPAPAGVAAR